MALFDALDSDDEPASPSASPPASAGKPPVAQLKCLVPPCPMPRKDKARFCVTHQCYIDSAGSQAMKDGGIEQRDKFREAMKDDDQAVDHVTNEAARNVGLKKYAKKKLISWSEWNQRFGKRAYTNEGERKVPYEKRQFTIRQVNKFGRSNERAEELWELADARAAKRDNCGDGGQKRLWLTKTEFIDVGKETFMEAAATEGSDRIKNPGNDVLDAMRLHAHRLQGHNEGHEFFRGMSTLHAQDAQKELEKGKGAAGDEKPASPGKDKDHKKRKRSPEDVVDLEGSEEDEDEDEQATKKARKASAASFISFRTSFYEKTSREFSKKDSSLNDYLAQALKALMAGRDAEGTADLTNNTDRTTRDLYVKSLSCRLVAAHAWFGNSIPEVVLEVSGLKEQDPPPQPAVPIASSDVEPASREVNTPAASSAAGEAVLSPMKRVAFKQQLVVPSPPMRQADGAAAGTAADAAPAVAAADAAADPAVAAAFGEPSPSDVLFGGPVKTEDVGVPNRAKNPDGYLLYYLDKFTSDELGIGIPKHMRSQRFAQELVDNLPTTPDNVKLTKRKVVWGRFWKALSDMEAGLKKASGDLSKHVVLIKSAKVKAESKKRDLEDKEAMALQKQALKSRQTSVQAKPAKTQDLPPMFQVLLGEKVKAMRSFETELGDVDLDLPFILTKSKAISDWIDDKVLQQVMDVFGKGYKKKAGFEEEQKFSQPLQSKQGKEPTEKMFSAVAAPFKKKLIDLSSVSSSWMSTSWLCGYSKQYSSVSLAPNSSSFLRVLWMGSMEVTAIEVESLVKALRSKENPLTTIEDLMEQVKAIGPEKIRTIDKEIKIFRGVTEAHSLLYVPCGWILVEKSTEDSTPLIYGSRKSSFYQSEGALTNYGQCKELLTGGQGSSTSASLAKMESIFDLIDAARKVSL